MRCFQNETIFFDSAVFYASRDGVLFKLILKLHLRRHADVRGPNLLVRGHVARGARRAAHGLALVWSILSPQFRTITCADT